eukprot:5811558-Prymnesium_polylepis.1
MVPQKAWARLFRARLTSSHTFHTPNNRSPRGRHEHLRISLEVGDIRGDRCEPYVLLIRTRQFEVVYGVFRGSLTARFDVETRAASE